MRAYKCDRCGAFTTRDFFVRKPSRIAYRFRFGGEIQICAKCASNFKKWLYNPEEEIRNDE